MENVTLIAELDKTAKKTCLTRARALLEQVGLWDRAQDFPETLSGGEQQRVAIVRALVNDPDLVLADEPTGNLDQEAGRTIMEMISDLVRKQNKTLIMVTHSPDAAVWADQMFTVADRTLTPLKQTSSGNPFQDPAPLILEGLMVTDISVAQEILDMKENITRIDLILPSRDTAAEIQNHLEKGLFLVETDQQNQAVRSLSRSFENSLTAFSMLALFMGIFLIYNTVSFSVSRRHRLHAILRALGTTRNEVFFTVMAEVMLYAVIGAVSGVVLERTREIGILRACGTLPRQVRGLLIHECFFYGLLSGIMAIPLGIALSWILIHVINQRTFGWTYDMILSPGILVQALVLSSAAALAAGIFPALAAGRIRKADGTENGYSFGSISMVDGTCVILSESDFTLTPTGHWKSPDTGTRYPVQWRIQIPDHDLDLHVTPVIDHQEHTHAFVYWEGAMRFTGNNVQGMGYLEMTGY
jgi:energy-coupling factor transporter ATP-binding protein EcfA2